MSLLPAASTLYATAEAHARAGRDSCPFDSRPCAREFIGDAAEAECARSALGLSLMDMRRALVVAASLGLAWLTLAFLVAGVLHAPAISADQARGVALERVAGRVLTEKYAREGARWVYTFDVAPVQGPARVVSVIVDAEDGRVVDVGEALARNGL